MDLDIDLGMGLDMDLEPWMHHGIMDATKPQDKLCFGAMDVTKP